MIPQASRPCHNMRLLAAPLSMHNTCRGPHPAARPPSHHPPPRCTGPTCAWYMLSSEASDFICFVLSRRLACRGWAGAGRGVRGGRGFGGLGQGKGDLAGRDGRQMEGWYGVAVREGARQDWRAGRRGTGGRVARCPPNRRSLPHLSWAAAHQEHPPRHPLSTHPAAPTQPPTWYRLSCSAASGPGCLARIDLSSRYSRSLSCRGQGQRGRQGQGAGRQAA